MSAVHTRDGAGGRPHDGRPPSGPTMIVILLTIGILMGFAVVASLMGNPTLAAVAGTGAIALACEFVRRLLNIPHGGQDGTDNMSVTPAPPPPEVDRSDEGSEEQQETGDGR